MENNEIKIKELFNNIKGDAIDEKMHYLTYKVISGAEVTEFDRNIMNEINDFFTKVGDEGTDLDKYLDFIKMSIFMNNLDPARTLISEIEKELDKNFMLPSEDIFSIYRDIAILEALASMELKAISHVNEILSFFPKKDVSMVEPLTEIALTIVDTIHLQDENYPNTSLIKEIMGMIPSKKEKDAFRGSIARKMVMRDEFTSSLNDKMIYFAEQELYRNIEDKIEKIYTASQIAIAKIMLGNTEKNKKMTDEGYQLIGFIKEALPRNASKTLKIFRDITLFKIYTILDLEKEAENTLDIIKSKIIDLLNKDELDKERGGVIYFFISSLFLKKFKNSSELEDTRKYANSLLQNAPDDVKLWSYIDMSTSLARMNNKDEAFSELKNAENYLEFFDKNERVEVIDEIFNSAISENYFYTMDQRFIDELMHLLSNVGEEERGHISAEFFYNLCQFGINTKMKLSLNI